MKVLSDVKFDAEVKIDAGKIEESSVMLLKITLEIDEETSKKNVGDERVTR